MSDSTMLQAGLSEYRQWVCWRRELRDGKQTKVPYRADGKGMASTTDAKKWATYETASKARGYDGIGFVVTLNDPYCGIDLDHCRDPETGVIDTWAMSIINTLASYTEITPSKAGVRIWIKGKLPLGGNKKTGMGESARVDIELYDHARYFTITGEHLGGTPDTIEDRQRELNELHASLFPKYAPSKPGGNGHHPVDLADTELINKAISAANGAAFTALWQGDTSAHNGDDSAADMALCNHLAFWTGNDPARIDSLFRQSSLYREKWERQDYRERTIQRAIENTKETYSSDSLTGHRDNKSDTNLPIIAVGNRQLRDLTADALQALEAPAKPKPFDWHDYAITHTDLLTKQLQPISFLVEDILIDTGTGVLAGRKKLGKSFLATQLSQSVASKADFLGHRVKQGKVVHFALEDGERRTQSRLRMQQARNDLPITYFYKWPAWNTPAGFTQLRAMLTELKPALVVVDTFAKILNGKPEQNSAGDMGDFGNRMHDLALELNLMILFIAHHGKGLQMTSRDPGFDIRGSSAIPGATDVNIGLYKNEDTTFELIGEGRDIPEFDFRVSFDKEATWAWQLEGEAQDLRRHEAEAKILEALELLGEADAAAIASQTDTSRVAANGHLKRMRSYEDSPITYRTKANKILYTLTTLTTLTDLTNKQSLLSLQSNDSVTSVRELEGIDAKANSKLPVRLVRDVPNTGELPDCPVCGRNKWTPSPDGEMVCPCGYRLKGAL